MKAIVNTAVCSLFGAPTRESTLEDEALYGMVVEVLEEVQPGWVRVRTHYRYEGIASADELLISDEAAKEWESLPKKVVRNKNFLDVLSQPKVQGFHMAHVPRGGLLSPVGEAEEGFQKVRLADGRTGYVMTGILAQHHTQPLAEDEDTMRRALVDAAMLYRGTHYRWGGKSPAGIDCSGLVSMAYMLCGVIIHRDANLAEGFAMKEISPDALRPGDAIFFPGHVAMYLGDGRYCHATARAGDDGFAINSLDPDAPDYRADLKEKITQVGSIFTSKQKG